MEGQQQARQTVADKIVRTMASPRSGHLNTWATWGYYKASGCRGFPSWEDCEGESRRSVIVADPPVLTAKEHAKLLDLCKVVDSQGHESAIPVYVDSAKLFDATPRKYDATALAVKIDHRVLDSIVRVEEALRVIDAPLWLRSYLMFLYPQWGRFVQHRPKFTEDDAASLFLDTDAAMALLIGNRRGAYLDRNARGLVSNMTAELMKEIRL